MFEFLNFLKTFTVVAGTPEAMICELIVAVFFGSIIAVNTFIIVKDNIVVETAN